MGASAAPAEPEPEEEEPDFSVEGIRRRIQQRWDHRPNGIRYARWQQMIDSFAQRMAARMAAERNASTAGAAATGAAGTNPEERHDVETSLTERNDPDEPQQSEL